MHDEMVLVYLYTYWDDDSKSHKTSTRYATAEAIRNGLGIAVLPSERKVRRRELIDDAFFVVAPSEFVDSNPLAVPIPKT